MSDIVTRRTTALDKLLKEFDHPPPVPPKDQRRKNTLAEMDVLNALPTPEQPPNLLQSVENMKDGLKKEKSVKRAASEHRAGPTKDSTLVPDAETSQLTTAMARLAKEDSQPEKTVAHVVSYRKKRVAFAANDEQLSPPPISLDRESFEDEMVTFELGSTVSVFDPPPAPRFSRFPDQLPTVPKRKPKPLDLTRPTSHTGKWKVRVQSAMWTPIDDEPDTASIISMDARNAPRLVPLPYKPVKSIPLRAEGSLRPDPLRIRKGVRFQSPMSPAALPLKSPGLKKVRFCDLKSPAASKFRTPPTPFSTASFAVLTPRRKRGVRFATAKSPATSDFKIPPTPYYRNAFQIPASSASKRNVRFDNIKSPAVSKFKTPPTPYYDDKFRALMPDKMVKFAELKSPAASSFRNPPTPYAKSNFRESLSPPDLSPVTPRAMHMLDPRIEPDSPAGTSQAFRPTTIIIDEPALEKAVRVEHETTRNDPPGEKYPPRTTSLQHRRHISLPKDLTKPGASEDQTILPTTTFDESAVGESTLKWLGMLPKPSYRVSNSSQPSDRNQILGSYFHRSTPSC